MQPLKSAAQGKLEGVEACWRCMQRHLPFDVTRMLNLTCQDKIYTFWRLLSQYGSLLRTGMAKSDPLCCSCRKMFKYVSLTLLALLVVFVLIGVIGAMLEPTEEEREAARQWAREMAERSIELERRQVFRENLRAHLRRALDLEDPGEYGAEYECDSCQSCHQ